MNVFCLDCELGYAKNYLLIDLFLFKIGERCNKWEYVFVKNKQTSVKDH